MTSMGHFGCLVPPITQAGFISFDPNPAKRVYGSATGGARMTSMGSNSSQMPASLRFDPHLTPRLSIPLEARGFFPLDGEGVYQYAGRMGVRYRPKRTDQEKKSGHRPFSLGAGIGVNRMEFTTTSREVKAGSIAWGGSIDVEVASSLYRNTTYELQVSVRPGVAFNPLVESAFMMPMGYCNVFKPTEDLHIVLAAELMIGMGRGLTTGLGAFGGLVWRM